MRFKKRFIGKKPKKALADVRTKIKTDVYCCINWLFGNIIFVKNSVKYIECQFPKFWEKSLLFSWTPKRVNVGFWRNYRMRSTSKRSQPWLSESIVAQPWVMSYAGADWKQKLRLRTSLRFVSVRFANLRDFVEIPPQVGNSAWHFVIIT